MQESCAKHQFESAEDVCRSCGWDFCGECLVYSFGATKAPYCLACALAASGVRSGTPHPALRSKKEIKIRHREWVQERASSQRQTPFIEVAAFEDFVTASTSAGHSPSASGDNNPLSWLDDQLGGNGERVPF